MTIEPHRRARADWPTDVLISADRTVEHAWADWLTAKLEPNGLAVHRVGTGDEAVRIVRRGSLGLAMLGARWPVRSGLGLLRRIRSVDPDVPCVLVASGIDNRYLRKALALSAYSILTLPVDRRVLRDLVATAFRRFYESELVL